MTDPDKPTLSVAAAQVAIDRVQPGMTEGDLQAVVAETIELDALGADEDGA